jgi:hypothetical protein
VFPWENLHLQQLCHHSRPRTNTQFGEYAPQMGANRPRADVKHISNNLVGMSFRNHSHNFLFSWAQSYATSRRLGQADEEIAGAIHYSINQDFFGTAFDLFDWLSSRGFLNGIYKWPDHFIEMGCALMGALPLDRNSAGRHYILPGRVLNEPVPQNQHTLTLLRYASSLCEQLC